LESELDPEAEVEPEVRPEEVPVEVEARRAGGGGGPRGTLIFTSETGLEKKYIINCLLCTVYQS
jgi:hypothetical protein